MKEKIEEYIIVIDRLLANDKTDFRKLKEDLLVHISFYQHERLVHLLVLMLVGIITTILLIATLSFTNIFLILLLIIFILLLIPYIFHYYFLENRVQMLYSLYDKVKDKIKK